MQLFVRNLAGRTAVLAVGSDDTVGQLKEAIEAKEGVPVEYQVLCCNGKPLINDETACQDYISAGATVHLTARLLGGKPVKVKIITNHLSCGQEVTIDVSPGSTRQEIKQKLAEVTGVPVEHQKIIMPNVDQIALADKRTNILHSSCGKADSIYMAVPK